MKRLSLLFLAAAFAAPAAMAQWQWIDKSGRKVFSDQPPPADVPASSIVRSPSKNSAGVPVPPPAPAPVAAVPAAPKLTGKDKELEDKRKRAEAEETEKKKQAEEERQAMRADNCARAKRSKAMFDSGVRVARVNDKGEREFMDDAQRAAEQKRLEGVIARDCTPPPQ